MPGVVIIGGAWGKSEHPKERSDQKPFVKRQIHLRRPDPKALTLLQRLLFPRLICGCSGTNASPDRHFLIIPTLQLLKNSIDVNKLSVYTPNTRHACSFFAQLRGVYFFICGQRCILRNSEEKRPLDAMVLAMSE